MLHKDARLILYAVSINIFDIVRCANLAVKHHSLIGHEAWSDDEECSKHICQSNLSLLLAICLGPNYVITTSEENARGVLLRSSLPRKQSVYYTHRQTAHLESSLVWSEAGVSGRKLPQKLRLHSIQRHSQTSHIVLQLALLSWRINPASDLLDVVLA